jgi:hypothetical protein
MDYKNPQFWLVITDIIRNVGLVAGGAFGLWLAYLRVTASNRQAEAQIKQADNQIRQAEMSRRDYVAELFNRAASQLRDDKQEMRLAAVFTFKQLCKDFPDLAQPIYDLLSAYIQFSPHLFGEDELPIEIIEIITILFGNDKELI